MMTSKKSHNSLRINVGFLLNQPVGTYRDIHFDPETVQLFPGFEVFNFLGLVRISRTRTGIFVQADFEGEVQLDCTRCLDRYSQPLSTSFGELYAFKEEDATESELLLPDDAYIDLKTLVYEYLLLEIPIMAICSEDCKGLCPVCGVNFNKGACQHMERAILSGVDE